MSSYYAFINDLLTCFICGEKFERRDRFKKHLSHHLYKSETLCEKDDYSTGTVDMYALNYLDSVTVDYDQNQSTFEDGHLHTATDFPVNFSAVKYKEIHACSTCGKEFKKKDHLKKHSSVHTSAKPFPCLVCGKNFARKDRLKDHCVIHLANGWSCYFCGKMFSQRCILRKHEMIHRGVKPFSCELCDWKFSRKNDLARHFTTHTGEKNHFCEICGKGFSQRRLVKRHLSIHRRKIIKM